MTDKDKAESLVKLYESFEKYFNAMEEGENYCGADRMSTLYYELVEALECTWSNY